MNVENHAKDEGGQAAATYKLRGSDSHFAIAAYGLVLQAQMNGIETKSALRGSTVSLGFISNRPSYFVLSGKEGNYNSVGNVADWMQRSLSAIGSRKIRDICVPSSHDAGMSKVTWSTRFANAGSLITQFLSVEQQLHMGVRYLDIRPVLYEGQWVCGHYSFIEPKNKFINPAPLDTWQGGNGEAIQDLIDGINRFTATSGELIVIGISHTQIIKDAIMSFARSDFEALDENHWNMLLNMFSNLQTGIKSLWKPAANEAPVTDLTSLSLNTYIGSGTSAVILVVDDNTNVAGHPGVFHDNCWQWDASAWWKPESGRMDEFRDYILQGHLKPYSFSGCHIQTDWEAILTTLGQSSNSILSLATEAKNRLFTELFSLCVKDGVYPAALSMDAIDSSDLAALCIAFNDCRQG